jgi:uncharacterized membrane protein YccC
LKPNVIFIYYEIAGATIYKSINRICGTTLAGLLALGVHWVASRAGAEWEPVIVGASLFLLGILLFIEINFYAYVSN